MATGIFKLRDQLLGLVQKAWTGSQTTPAVEYLVVAGGGGGGGNLAGGGGGGGLLQGILPITTGTPLTVTIGTGGAGSASTTGTTGVDSVFSSITAKGGGGGATAANGTPGGSGGGTAQYGIGSVGGSGISGQGNAGGTSTSGSGSTITGSGGGGAGTVGIGGTSSLGGNGGAGIASSISGTVTAYAGGGGGGAYAGQTAGIGGVGGGGRGADATNAAVAGTANTGGGGGGSGYPTNPTGQAGGSGICIISYPDIYNAPASFGGANSPTASTSGSGSMYFNNPAGVSNQAITYTTTTSAQSFGSGDFCLEAFVWWSSSNGAAPYVATNYVGSSNYYWGLYQQGTVQFYVYGGVYLNSGTFTNNAWNHIVVCRTSGTTSMFLNGTRTATASDGVTYATAASLYVGQNNINGNMMNGYISNFRIVVGNSIYSASATSITVPTAPFALTSQTKVLLGTVSPNAYLETASALTPTLVSNTGSVSWNQLSPFATGLGYKNRVYTWTASGTVTF